MYVDAVTTAAVADELNNKILGGRVQAVVEADDQSIGLEIYARERFYLLMSIAPSAARCHLVPEKLRRGVEHPTQLGLLLRKYVDGARLEAITQPPWERVLHFDFSGENGETRLIVETMDKRSNLILTAEDDILDSLKRVGSDQNRYRVILPGKAYVPPPPQDKLFPERVTPDHLRRFLAADPDTPAWRVLVTNVAGISPLFAREVIYRASEDAEAPAFDISEKLVFEVFYRMIADVVGKRWSPCVVEVPEREGYAAFAAYLLTHLQNVKPRETISEAITDYFGAPVGAEAYLAGKETVQAQLNDALDRARRKLAALDRESAGADDIEMMRQKGELLYAYAYSIQPKQAHFEAQYDPEGPTISIELDPALTPVENAKKYFERYEKAKRALDELPALQEAARNDLRYLEQVAIDLRLAENWPEIDEVRAELQEGGYWRGERTRGPKGGKPGIRRFAEEGFTILVGRNAAQNQTLLSERSAPGDLWLHARNIPGSHVLIKNDGRPIPDGVLQRAAELAAYYSAGRGNTSVEVDVTERRYVRPIKGGGPGMVNYKNEQTLNVRPRKD